MKPAVLLSNNYFIALAFLFGWRVDEALSCNTNWVRMVFMLSCGKKKRESVWAQNNTFYENIPTNFEEAFRYFKERDPSNPMLSDPFFYKILGEDDEKTQVNHEVPKLLLYEEREEFRGKESVAITYKPATTASVLLQKLFPKTKNVKHLEDFEIGTKGIPGFPQQWNVEEIADEKINDNHRREIKRLIDECCKEPPVPSCNEDTFAKFC